MCELFVCCSLCKPTYYINIVNGVVRSATDA